jgi:PPOX class probable F420-dependent enzyme
LPVALPPGLLALLRRPSPCFVATLMPDGSPQLTETWVTTDGEHVVINIVAGRQKARNIDRDTRVAVAIADPDELSRYYAVRGRVVDVTGEGGTESIDAISRKYTGRSYADFRGVDDPRLVVTIAAESVHSPHDR